MAKHQLIAVFSTPEDSCGVAIAVRWCVKCGAVVVDRDIDGQPDPGAIVPLRRPQVSKPKGVCD